MKNEFNVMGDLKRIQRELFDLFGKEESEKLIELEWENVKHEYNKIPDTIELTTRLLIEDLIIYNIAAGGKEGYDKIIEIKEMSKIQITIKPYEEFEKHYEKYINILREHLKKNKDK